MNPNQELKKFLNRLHRWVIWRHLVNKLMWCVPVGISGGAILELIAYFIPWYHVHVWALGIVGASLVAALIWGIITCPGVRDAALLLDHTGLKERTVTAWELLEDDSFFANMQKQDTWNHLSGISVRKRLPIRMAWKRPAFLGAAIAFFLVSLVAPSPAKQEAAKQHLVAEQVREEEEKIEQVSEELAQENLTAEEQEEYQELLEQIKQELNEAKTQEKLDKTLERAEYKLSQMAEREQNKSVKEKMQQLSASLGGSEKDSSAEEQQELQAARDVEQLSEEAEELLEKLAENAGELSEEELEALQEALEQLAQSARDNDMADLLQSAASQISTGSLSASELASVQATLSTIKQQAQTQLAQNQTGSQQAGNGNNGNSGNENGSGNGSGSGNGNGSGTGWNYGGKHGKEQETSYNGELVSVPNEVGEDDNLTGAASEGTSYSSQGGPALTWSGNQVSYEQVLGTYSDQAMSKIQGSDYPSGVQDIVKSYFEELNQ